MKIKLLLKNRLRYSSYNVKRSCSFLHCKSLSSRATESENGQSSTETLISSDFPNSYNPSSVEERILKKWENRESKSRAGAPTFRMLLPPPNVTGKLHLGHTLTLAIQDTIARWKVMKGFQLEWIPGFDHAGIATHSIVSRIIQTSADTQIADLKTSIHEFAQNNSMLIQEQLQSMGPLLNWESSYYTLDESHSLAVKEAFVHLFESGLIRRGNGLVNWSCTLGSSVADVEVDQLDFNGKTTIKVPGYDYPVEFGVLYYFAYPLENSNETLLVATSRPETMFGDVAIAVNPLDSRYIKFIGKNVVSPLTGRILPIIGDGRVKTDFGSGVVKITPAHDKMDFSVGLSHNLEHINVFTFDGFMNKNANSYKEMGRFTARIAVIEDLDKAGALKGTKDYSGSLGICNRSGDIIEPMVLPHWFFQTGFLTKKFIEAIESKKFIISPDHNCKHLLNQLSDPQDWCLSRQINWGHRIPAYYHEKYPDQWVSAIDFTTAKFKLENKLNIKINNDSEIKQDEDVIDTWFSSALIPLSVSGWPDCPDLKEVSLMETGNDILLFWVWRMVIVTLALVNQYPFKHVLLHGIVTDHYGRKMSKSRGNVIDPVHIVKGISLNELLEDAKQSLKTGELQKNEYDLRVAAVKKDFPEGFKPNGTDALRFSLLSHDIFTEDIKINTSYLENCRNFTNKIWQALRFYRMHSEKNYSDLSGISKPLKLANNLTADHWLLACLYDLAVDSEKHLDTARFHLYADSVRKFFYQQLCDVYIELIKNDLKYGLNCQQHLLVMGFALETGLKIAHPLIPFVTEEMWSHLNHSQNGILIDQKFPSSDDLKEFENPDINELVMKSMKIVKEIRSLKVRCSIKAKTRALVYLEIPSTKIIMDLKEMTNSIESLSCCQLQFDYPPGLDKSNFMTVVFQLSDGVCKISCPKGDKTDEQLSAEKSKMLKMQIKLLKLKEQYDNPKFQKYAPAVVKEKLRKKVEVLESQLNEVNPSSNENTL